MNIESLDVAIKEFNEWNKSARIYYNTTTGEFEASVYNNDVQATESFSSDEFIAVYSKGERQTFSIGKTRRQYIIDYVDLRNKGYDPMQAEYKLAKKYGMLHF